MIREYILSLISRMNTPEDISTSHNSVRWRAYREAEQISDVTYLPVLENIICEHNRPSDKKTRNSAYFILGKIIKNRFNVSACKFLICRLSIEKDKYILSNMLDRLADICIPTDMDIEPIIVLSKNENSIIRHSAINALGSCKSEKCKLALRYYSDQEDEKKYKYEIIYANASLGKIGDVTDIPLLQKHSDSRIRDIRESTRYAINEINKRN